MKGWIDRVIRPGIVFNTSNTSAERENNIFKDPLETIWKNCIFDFCGVKRFDRRMFRIIVTSDLKQRQVWLSEVEMLIDEHFEKINKNEG